MLLLQIVKHLHWPWSWTDHGSRLLLVFYILYILYSKLNVVIFPVQREGASAEGKCEGPGADFFLKGVGGKDREGSFTRTQGMEQVCGCHREVDGGRTFC